MKLRHLFAFTSMLLLAGCGGQSERGVEPIARGTGLGQEWSPSGPNQMRIAVKNSLTGTFVVRIDSSKAHFELTVGPKEERYMIVPLAEYKFFVFNGQKSAGNNYIFDDDHNGAKGLVLDITHP